LEYRFVNRLDILETNLVLAVSMVLSELRRGGFGSA
jgi:hypothetical protein